MSIEKVQKMYVFDNLSSNYNKILDIKFKMCYISIARGVNVFMELNNKTVGEIIAEARETVGISKNQLAEKTKISHTEIARIESGEREVPPSKTLRKISKYIGINYNDLMYASGQGALISPLNPYLIEHYSSLKGNDLKEALNNVESAIKNNNVVIASLKKSSEEKNVSDEEKNMMLETIEDLEYQNGTNEEIIKLLNTTAIKEFRDGK